MAASVRTRSMALRHVGVARCREVAAQPTLADGIARLAGTVYGAQLRDAHDASSAAAAPSLRAAEHAVWATTLWQLRVLGGWMPASGSSLGRALAAEFEAENILAQAEWLREGLTPSLLDLGALATAWARAQEAQTMEELGDVLRTSRWGEVDEESSLRDLLTLARLRRLAGESMAARPWARAHAGLLLARLLLVDGVTPSRRFRQLARPLVGERWEGATTLPELRDALPRPAATILAGIEDPRDLWRAEARLHATMESDAFRLLRAALPGPDVVLGGVTFLAVDAWRVRAALAAAATAAGGSEVLDAVA